MSRPGRKRVASTDDYYGDIYSTFEAFRNDLFRFAVSNSRILFQFLLSGREGYTKRRGPIISPAAYVIIVRILIIFNR